MALGGIIGGVAGFGSAMVAVTGGPQGVFGLVVAVLIAPLSLYGLAVTTDAYTQLRGEDDDGFDGETPA